MQIKDREGLWYQQQDMLSKFLRRSEKVELICPVQFGKMFTTAGVKSNEKEEKNVEDNELEAIDEDSNIENSDYDSNKNKFHYIITETDESVPLPNIIEILQPYPGEPRWMKKRKRSSSNQIPQGQ